MVSAGIIGAIGPMFRFLWPHIAGWGIHRLFNSAFGRSYLPPQMQQQITQATVNAIKYLPKPKNSISHTVKYAGGGMKNLKDTQDLQDHEQHKYNPLKHRKLISKLRAKSQLY